MIEALGSSVQLVKETEEQGVANRRARGVLGLVRLPLLLDPCQGGNHTVRLVHRGVEDPSMMVSQSCQFILVIQQGQDDASQEVSGWFDLLL